MAAKNVEMGIETMECRVSKLLNPLWAFTMSVHRRSSLGHGQSKEVQQLLIRLCFFGFVSCKAHFRNLIIN